MKILITGGAGFIGSHIQDRLIEEGHEVAVLDNFRSGKEENLNPKSTLYKVDVLDKNSLKTTFEEYKPEAVFHLAAQNEVPYSMEHPFEDQEANIVGMMNLMEVAKDTGVKKIIYSNTGGAYYGEVDHSQLPLKEDTPILRPTSFYGVSKGAAELYLRLYSNLYGISYVSLRYANVYGPRQAGNREAGIVVIFTSKMLNGETPSINGDGSHTRDYVYVGDVVEANIKALAYSENDYFNISTGVETNNTQVFEEIEKNLNTGMKVQYGPARPGDATRTVLSPQKAKEKLGWEAKIDFAQGVQQTIEFYRK